MLLPQGHTAADALQLAVSPVILLSACALLMLSMTNRLGRAIDRARILVRETKRNKHEQIAILVRRAHWIRSAILCIAICIGLTSVLILVLFLSVFLPFSVSLLVVSLFILALLSLIASITYFIIDIFSSLHAMEADVEGLDDPAFRDENP